MKIVNIILCLVLSIIIVTAQSNVNKGTINIVATTPLETEEVWIIGDFINWDLSRAIKGTKKSAGTFSFSIPDVDAIEYRLYNARNWNFPEVGEFNPTVELPNRKANYQPNIINTISVWNWKNNGFCANIKSVYPIIFVHGLNSGSYTWGAKPLEEDLPKVFERHGLITGGDLNISLDYNRTSLMNTKEEDVHFFPNKIVADFYKINFNVRHDGSYPGDNVQANGFINQAFDITSFATAISVSKPEKYRTGDILCIDNEYLIVESIVPPNINVLRGQFGSEKIAHSAESIIWNLSLESNQASIAKQGLGLKIAIDSVKTWTKAKKVILIGHSMGGLAIREYLRTYYHAEDVAKVVTIGTPHLGSTMAELSEIFLINENFVGVDTKSEAIRDLSYNYDKDLWSSLIGKDPVLPFGENTDNNGVFLFGGGESYLTNKEFYNPDVNANGAIDMLNVSGINIDSKTNFPSGISYSWIVSQWEWFNENITNGDGAVRLYRQFPWFKTDNGKPLIEIGDTIMTNKMHLDEPTDYYSLLRGLDEPASSELAYEIGNNSEIVGYITDQNKSPNTDIDLYKINVVKDEFLTVSLVANNQSGVGQLALLNSSLEAPPLSFKSFQSSDNYVDFTYHVKPGTYYISVRGAANNNTHKYPYKLSTNNYLNLRLKYPSGNEVLKADSTVAIIWENSNFVGNIKIDFSINGGTDWQSIVSNYPAINGSYSWLLPEINSNNCKIRITDIVNNDVFDENEDTFTVLSKPSSITTIQPTEINSTYAVMSGVVESDGGSDIINRGFCWNTYGNPTILDKTISAGLGIGKFTSKLSNLSANTTYYVKAFSSNNVGTTYGNEIFFKTTTSQIIDIEYFFDFDPGVGNGKKIIISSDSDVLIKSTLNIRDLSTGLHRIYFRVKDSTGKWSIPQSQLIIVQAFNPKATQITASEYFFDSDPGVGNGISLPVQSSDSISISNIQNIQNISTGLHRIYFRVKNNLGNWSIPQSQLVIVQAFNPKATQIIVSEYFFDSDPGVGNGISMSVQSGDSISINTIQNIENISTGLHRIYFRVKDNLGNWSIPQSQLVIIQNGSSIEKINYAEYYFDSDPGFGKATKFVISSTNDLFINETLNVGNLTQGIHTINVRVRDESGKWSIPVSAQFEVIKDIATDSYSTTTNNEKNYLIYGGKNQFSVITPTNQNCKYQINVFDLNGKQIINKQAIGSLKTTIERGFYVVEIIDGLTNISTNQKIFVY